MSSTVDIASSFVEGAPPGELNDVVSDIKQLAGDANPDLVSRLKPAFQRYNETQLICTKLPGAAEPVLVSKYNRVPDSTSHYYDNATSTSFEFDHITQKASAAQSYTHDSAHTDLIKSTLKSLSGHFAEHYPSSSASAYTVVSSPESQSEIVILVSTTKASPSNFISGRWRSVFTYDTARQVLSGSIQVHVHYYEDGNVALTTKKEVADIADVSSSGSDIVRRIAAVEKQYQEEVNRALVGMNEDSFKTLRRQLPVTRQRVEWEKVRGYSLGGDLKGEVKQ